MLPKNKKTIAILLPLYTMVLTAASVFINTISGRIGNYEVWRIICASVGLLIFSITAGIVSFKILQNNYNKTV
jgi:hypothetical protein